MNWPKLERTSEQEWIEAPVIVVGSLDIIEEARPASLIEHLQPAGLARCRLACCGLECVADELRADDVDDRGRGTVSAQSAPIGADEDCDIGGFPRARQRDEEAAVGEDRHGGVKADKVQRLALRAVAGDGVCG